MGTSPSGFMALVFLILIVYAGFVAWLTTEKIKQGLARKSIKVPIRDTDYLDVVVAFETNGRAYYAISKHELLYFINLYKAAQCDVAKLQSDIKAYRTKEFVPNVTKSTGA